MKKKLSILFLALFVALSFNMSTVKADNSIFKVTKAEITDKSKTTKVNSFKLKKEKIYSDITFHNVKDYVVYDIQIKNNSKEDYTIKEITDNNKKSNIKYEYDKNKKYNLKANKSITLRVKVVYNKEEKDVSKRDKNIEVKLLINYVDKNGKSGSSKVIINPNTSDKIVPIMIVLLVSTVGVILVIKKKNSNKNNKKKNSKKVISTLLALALLIPTVVVASSTKEVLIKSTYRLYDKLVVTIDVEGKKEKRVIKYSEKLNIEEPVIEGKAFEKWVTKDGKEFKNGQRVTEDIELTAKMTERIAYLQRGKDALLKIYKAAGVNAHWENYVIEDEPYYFPEDDEGLIWEVEIKKIKKATKEEYNSVKDTLTEDNIISTEDGVEVYTWYNEDEHTSYYYSEAKKIYLNEDSSYLLCCVIK